ncbi:MAG: bifunctional phosphoglucose/phosphomannose isomerase [Candidatus Saccharibacteria bacterium]|nr:bifunctional phosphoglucose/phosphomannose isomerase [Candidatus Saccharibacteria bacterium]
MLDDLKYIHQKDGSDALGIAGRQARQLAHEFTLEWQPENEIKNVVLAGMGGSALAGLLSTTWPDYHVPFEIVRDYDIPTHVNDNTLFIASSYSGNTEETLSALGQAEAAGAQIVILSGGGKLIELAEEKSYPYEVIPKVEQPRFAVFYALKAYVTILERAGLVKTTEAEKTMHRASTFIARAVEQWGADRPTSKNPAKELALELAGSSPVIYAGPKLFPAAYKWKISFNENAKNVAWCNEYPEFNHNEFMGWTSHPVEKPYKVVELRSNLEHPRTQKRFEVSERLLSGKRPAPEVVEVQGETILEQLLWAVAFGDFVSIYVALLNGVDPSPVKLIEKFKKDLG